MTVDINGEWCHPVEGYRRVSSERA